MNAQVAKQVRESRKAQGLGPAVDDARLLELLVAEVVGQAEEIVKEAAA